MAAEKQFTWLWNLRDLTEDEWCREGNKYYWTGRKRNGGPTIHRYGVCAHFTVPIEERKSIHDCDPVIHARIAEDFKRRYNQISDPLNNNFVPTEHLIDPKKFLG